MGHSSNLHESEETVAYTTCAKGKKHQQKEHEHEKEPVKVTELVESRWRIMFCVHYWRMYTIMKFGSRCTT